MTKLNHIEDEEIQYGVGACIYRLFRTFRNRHYTFDEVLIEDADEDFVNSVMWSMNDDNREGNERLIMVGYSQFGTKVKEVRL